ncbi:hypothetical protein [Herbaspirillum frisingense]|uniref:hypothetical protein n=1 Tax=Herbaspirillum frisingense TaxID=92645 RepID=UPI001F20BE77|nr:hypothetical protein [Herbaspirillum frisingense]UIN21234.1 hypothetical protein LAZ82_22735 [Herbaspirillum frisingense]
MGTWIKRSLFVCVIFAVTWVMFIAYWSGSNHMPDIRDIILFLLVLPVCFLLAMWAVRRLRLSLAAAAAARQAAAQAPAPELPAAPAHHVERHWALVIAASALRSPQGDDAPTLLSQLQKQDARLDLDTELNDRQGFPILAGRIDSLDLDGTRSDYLAWHRTQHGEASAPAALPAVHLRTMTLAADIIRELGQRLQAHPFLSQYLEAPVHQREAVGLPQLHLLALLPARWDGAHRLQVAQWLGQLLAQQGWPREKITVLPVIAGEPVHPMQHLDRLIATSRDVNTKQPSSQLTSPYLAVAVAAESCLDDTLIEEWEAQQQLLCSSSTTGKSPGEGAAGLILADATQAIALGTDALVLLHRAALGRNERSADARGRVDSELLSRLVQASLQDAGVAPAAIGLLATDSDYRASRTEETMKMGYDSLPDLDLGSQCVKLGAGCGAAGAATVMSTLVLAHRASEQLGQAALCVSNDDAHERAAMVVRPQDTGSTHSTPTPEATAAQAANA